MQIRPAKLKDAHEIARVYVRTWRDTYRNIVPDGYLDAMAIPEVERSFLQELQDDQTFSFIAQEGGEKGVVGFVTGGFERKRDWIYSGEIYTLYVLKNYQRRGIGLQLVCALAEQLNRFDIYAMMVWVLKQNPYRQFYEKINGIFLRSQRIPFAGTALEAIAYGWINTDLILTPL
ncbi:MAG: GNAT family N-acetyltransferase [Desulfobacterales bacterium]|nr:MAG: GNAT family N-acetyltransferase [Desulfobacterales bacterium]